MSFNVTRERILDVDEEKKVIDFDPRYHGKVTGSRLYAILGRDPYMSAFRAACFIGRFYSEFEPSKYTEAGDVIEPIIRSHVNDCCLDIIRDEMSLGEGPMKVEQPVDKKLCKYDHFGSERVFGGMVDGYIRHSGKRVAILEIKTASDRSKWYDDRGKLVNIPENYLLQASLYAVLNQRAGFDVKKIVFAVGFPTEEEYDHPGTFVPSDDNFGIVVVDAKDISEEMAFAEDWFNRYILKGETPAWTEADEELVSRILS